ncbi:glucosamine-6-phosphate deaminase [Clostridium sp. AL.422]|uniref:glucosamine-6-phosphate deaminase n=1 Tax=Clostridium TaxID=1485 RepID=UPI00293DF1DA|nr:MULTISPECIES: glucosamine-6-phosphate deaminase [unclassified Clostridium]MDV4151373.1 glucosamine-6-phosphate deaminase [Clostridium sp. AL.422]
MKVNILEDYKKLSMAVADYIIDQVKEKPESLLCLAGGDTPLLTYNYLAQAYTNGKVDFSKCRFVSLDEWVGLDINVKGSCIETLYNNLYYKLNLNSEQICFFDGKARDLNNECKRIDNFIFINGGIDLILLGIGMNGHIGFNEPNVNINKYSQIFKLDDVTKNVCVKYFEESIIPEAGMSLGMKHILEAKKVVLMANSIKKADIVYRTIRGEKSVEVPSSLIRAIVGSQIFLDYEAASKLV